MQAVGSIIIDRGNCISPIMLPLNPLKGTSYDYFLLYFDFCNYLDNQPKTPVCELYVRKKERDGKTFS